MWKKNLANLAKKDNIISLLFIDHHFLINNIKFIYVVNSKKHSIPTWLNMYLDMKQFTTNFLQNQYSAHIVLYIWNYWY